MKKFGIACVVTLGFGCLLIAPEQAVAQKIIHVKHEGPAVSPEHVRVRKHGRLLRRGQKKFKPLGKTARLFTLPEQRYFPPYYEHPRLWAHRPDTASRLRGGLTVRQGSPWRSRIVAGRTVQGGSRYASRIRSGRTVQGGSRWASRIPAGKSVDQGSRWASRMSNWRFSGYAAPMRPKGIPYFRAQRRLWASRLY